MLLASRPKPPARKNRPSEEEAEPPPNGQLAEAGDAAHLSHSRQAEIKPIGEEAPAAPANDRNRATAGYAGGPGPRQTLLPSAAERRKRTFQANASSTWKYGNSKRCHRLSRARQKFRSNMTRHRTPRR